MVCNDSVLLSNLRVSERASKIHERRFRKVQASSYSNATGHSHVLEEASETRMYHYCNIRRDSVVSH